jgi:hypothetical protein
MVLSKNEDYICATFIRHTNTKTMPILPGIPYKGKTEIAIVTRFER